MGASADQISTIRRWVSEPLTTTYSDLLLTAIIEKYKLTDAAGYDPTLPDGTANTAWTETYDLHAAAAQIWEEKGATNANKMDFSVEGGGFKASQLQENAMKMSRYHASRRAIRALRIEPQPKVADGS
jgi:hypothetical protein